MDVHRRLSDMYRSLFFCLVICTVSLVYPAPVIQPHHEPLNQPGSFDQLLEAWEEEDGMSPDNFSPKSFFMMHDLDGNNELSPDEIAVILEREMEKLNSTEPDANRTYVDNVLKEMKAYFMDQFDHNGDGKITLDEFMNTIGYSPKHTGEWTPHEDQLRAEAARQQHEFEQMHRNQPLEGQGTYHGNPSPGFAGQPPPHPGGPGAHPSQMNINAGGPQLSTDHFGSPQMQPGHPGMHQGVPMEQTGQHFDYHNSPGAHPSQMNINAGAPPMPTNHLGSPQMQPGQPSTHQGVATGQMGQHPSQMNHDFGAAPKSADHFASEQMQPGHQGVQMGVHLDHQGVPGAQPIHMTNNFGGPPVPVDHFGAQQWSSNHQEMHPGVPAGHGQGVQPTHPGQLRPDPSVHPSNPVPVQPVHQS